MSSSSQPGRVARAATRYRPGKAPNSAPAGPSSSSEDDSSDEEQHRRRQERKKAAQERREEPITDVSRGTAALKDAQRRTAGIVIQSSNDGLRKQPVVKLQDVKIGRQQTEEIDSDEYETDTDESQVAGPSAAASKPVFKKPGLPPPIVKKESTSEYETDSEEEEESEEDNRPVMLKPIFVPKSQRGTLQQAAETAEGKDAMNNGAKKEAAVEEGEVDEEEDVATRKARLLMEERRKQSHLLAAATIKREMAEKEHQEGLPDIDDTDGIDAEEEFSAWRIRELSRLKADRELTLEKEAERDEVERRRAMPESQRLAEDTARAQASRDAKRKERQEAAGGDFLQKYYHKGSFFQDLDILKKRDYHAKTESAVDVSMLPKVMQVKDYGKAGRSKWTHLSNEDTSRQQPDHRLKGMSGANGQQEQHQNGTGAGLSCFACGGPHLKRDCPTSQQSEGRQGRGANSVPVRDRSQYSRDPHRRSRSPPERSRSRYD
jgi:microfibrillar-associated protein 1